MKSFALATPFLVLALALSACSSLGRGTPGSPRAFILSLDGAGARITDEMVAKGHMPNLAALRAKGAWAAHSVASFPSKTAAGHAALWTGAMSGVNGITGKLVFSLPRHAHSILEVEDGFSSEALLAEPIWITVARAGKRAIVLQATHVAPVATYEPGGRFGGPFKGSLTLLDGHANKPVPDALYAEASRWQRAVDWANMPAGQRHVEQPLKIEDATWWAMMYDDPQDPVQGYDTLAVAPDKRGPRSILKPGSGSPLLPFSTARASGSFFFHLFELAPDASRFSLYRSAFSEPVSNKPDVVATWYGTDAPFIPAGPARLWSQGRFGPTVFQGGTGQAEHRYLTVLERLFGMASSRLQRLLARPDWDLAVCYLPFPDEALHRWYAPLDSQSPSYDPALAASLSPHVGRLFRLVDSVLAPLVMNSDTIAAVVSDHGMAGLRWHFSPNRVLQDAGLLVLDRQGRVDLSRTRALYPATNGAFIVVNETGYKGGIVKPQEVSAVIKQVERAFSRVLDASGRPVVTRMWQANDPEMGLLGVPGARAGHLYLDLQPGYYFDAAIAPARVFRQAQPGSGNHIFDPRRPDMQATMLFAGPGIRSGLRLPPVSHADLAPTIARALGVPRPAQATGRVLDVLE
jgi:predicted AlkP superfamily phosphohydrolase/phosphomutase